MTLILPGALPLSPGASRPDAQVKFNGSGGEFVTMCVKGAFLQLLTFGFYRFWLATDIRRHLWSHTAVEGEPLEYTGRGKELFVGFLIALAILVPINVAYFAVGIWAETAQAFASLPFILFFVLFGQFALYRARRYRLTRSIWRGVRFWMTGSGWSYAFRWLGWGLLTALTLGLALPWMRAALERYKLENTWYGDLRGAFVGRGADFFVRGLGYWLFFITPLILLAIGAFTTLGLKELIADLDLDIDVPTMQGYEAVGSMLAGAGAIWLVLVPLLWPFFRALEWRWWAAGVRFGDLSLKCDISGWSLLGIYVKLFFMSLIVAFGVSMALGAVGMIAAAIFGFDINALDPANMARLSRSIPLIAGFALGYLVLLLAMGVVSRFYLTREVWRLIATSIQVLNPGAADNVAGRGAAANALGEGLADGLDVAGF